MNPQNNLPNQQPTPVTPPVAAGNVPSVPAPAVPQTPAPAPMPQPGQAMPAIQPQVPVAPRPATPQPFMNTNLQAAAQTNLNQYAPPVTPQPQPNQQPAAPETPHVVENPISTQSTLQFSELRDSLVIMKDGSFRAVVACQSINFDLMSEQEREGVEYSYQNFLNSLNFTTQILVRSQKIDIAPYIEKLVNLRRNNDNMLLGVLMDDYINFIDVLSQEANIMDKSFFIIIPYYASADLEQTVEQTKNFFKAFGKTKAPAVTRINRDVYNKAIDELNNRVESVISGLFQIGIQSVRLNTKELSELFYNFNNPDTAVREPLVDFTKVATTYVKKGVKE